MLKRLLVTAVVAAAVAVAPASVASAAPGFDPATPKAATAAQSCAFIAYYAERLSGAVPEDWSFQACVKTIAAGGPALPYGDPAEACAEFEAQFLTYPYAFYADAPPGTGFPGLIAYNSTQCSRAVWAFHALIPYLGGE